MVLVVHLSCPEILVVPKIKAKGAAGKRLLAQGRILNGIDHGKILGRRDSPVNAELN
ncbi:MAG: hypothetical protein R3C18_04240 [Planctomycetaceae bacterium]